MKPVNIMMFGGRRCGKTSVLAAMKECFGDVFGGTDLEISIDDPDTMYMLQEKRQEIENYFSNKTKCMTFNCEGTDDMVDYEMSVSIAGKKGSKIHFNFCDFPGEWLIKYKQRDDEYKTHYAQLTEKMADCDIIIIAVDSIYLMEKAPYETGDCVGRYNSGRNYCSFIANMVKEHFRVSDDSYPKMILFVPIKCETYFDNNQMNLLNQRIHTGYKELFDFVQNKENRQNYQVVIAPILTFGEKTVRFSRFEHSTDGQKETNDIVVDDVTKIPTVAKFLFKNMNATYKPEFCEQPLLYIIAYLVDLMKKSIEEEKANNSWYKNVIRGIFEKYGTLASAEDFLKESQLIMGKLKKSGDGYELVNDPLGFSFGR